MSQRSTWTQPVSTAPTSTTNDSLAAFIHESSTWRNSIFFNNTNSMPHASAVKSSGRSHSSLAASNASLESPFDYNGSLASWSWPELGPSKRVAWNANALAKSDGALDDGTSIWGDPATKRTGIDWAEKEMLQRTQVNNNLKSWNPLNKTSKVRAAEWKVRNLPLTRSNVQCGAKKFAFSMKSEAVSNCVSKNEINNKQPRTTTTTTTAKTSSSS